MDTTGGRAKGTVRCLAYQDFAIVITSDPDVKGDQIVTRLRKPKEKDKSLCDKKPQKRDLRWAAADGMWFKGVIGPYAVATGEGLGAGNELVVVKKQTGAKVHADSFNDERGFDLHEAENGKWTMTYSKILDVPCSLAKEGDVCWAKVLTANAVPKTVTLEKPVCPADDSAHVAADVTVEDIEKPQPTYVGGKTWCTPHP